MTEAGTLHQMHQHHPFDVDRNTLTDVDMDLENNTTRTNAADAGPDFDEPVDVENLNSLDIIEAVALGCPVGQSMPSPSSTTFSEAMGVDDLEKGEHVTMQRSLGAAHETVSGITLVGKPEISPRASTIELKAPPRRAAQVKETYVLPAKRYNPAWRSIRHKLFGVYQRLFSFVFIINMAALITLTVLNKDKHPFGPKLDDITTAIAANVTVSILMRQEYIINALYGTLCLVPLWMPLRLRRGAAKLYHFGGVHSGAAVSALMWFILYTVLVTLQFVQAEHHDASSIAVLCLTYVLVTLFFAICVFAHPRFRGLFHNTFEAVHRFGGWLAVALFWALTILSLHMASSAPGADSTGMLIVKSPAFWMLVVVTFCIILPWLRLKKVPVRAEYLSDHAVRLHFTFLNHARPLFGIRIATSPLAEWHSFANIPSPNKQTFTCVISAAGDWTRKQIQNPQPAYWVRGIPVRGVLRMSVIFRKVVVVATGSGIGPVLSLTNGTGRCPQLRILWSTPNPVQTFGAALIEETKSADPDVTIWNTREKGRPDMVGMTYQLYRESGAEAVFVISNPALTRKIVYAMESRGIPAYGPIWDS